MLQEIHLKNYTLIDTLNLSLENGMTVITGETGAGKSIIINAIELALGERLENQVVPEHAKQTEISLCFDLKNNLAAQVWLKQRDLYNDDICILRRVITKEGKSKSYINGQPMTLHNLAEFGELLINIHGQHQHQMLVKHHAQREILDDYGNYKDLAQEVFNLHHEWQMAHKKYNELKNLSKNQHTHKEFLLFQLDDFKKLQLQNDELKGLNSEHKSLAHADEFIQSISTSLETLSEKENQNIIDQLHFVIKQLQNPKLPQEKIQNSLNLLQSALLQIEEANSDLKFQLEEIDTNPEKLHQIEQRLRLIYDTARKHRITPEEIFEKQISLENELDTIENSDAHLQKILDDIAIIEKNYFAKALQLSQKRAEAAKDLSKKVTTHIKELGMGDGKFSVELKTLTENKPESHGLEKIEFMVSANAGMSLQSLHKVASGGELSRISLAIQVIIAQKIQTPVLIFDEVDVGIGGKTADIVGRLLKKLGAYSQVLCITHLAQVASQGDHHLSVAKQTKNKLTKTSINILNENDRVEEIARMIGGLNITENTRIHAKEMLGEI